MTAIELHSLTKQYKKLKAVDSLNLEIKEGELFALLGVNGAGKTTTVKMLACLTSPTSGDATVLGHSIIKEPNAVKRLIGISPQETAVAPNLTVEENLNLMCGVYGIHGEARKKRFAETVEAFSLSEILRKKAGKLSGGWQRRLSIAMASVGSPKVLFLDEPTLGLDVLARSELWDTVQALKGKVTVILTTHYMEEVEALADRLAIMKSGKLLALGTVQEIKEKAQADTLEQAFITVVKGGTSL